MKYYATIYIDPITDWQGFTHAFLGLTHTHPDELDSLKNIDIYKYQVGYYSDKPTLIHVKDKWHNNIYPSILSDEFAGEGFWGFAPVVSTTSHWGKVFENNQYIPKWHDIFHQYTYVGERPLSTFWHQNRCVFEISKEQYKFLLDEIKKEVMQTKKRNPTLQEDNSKMVSLEVLKENLYYNSMPISKYPYHNCTTWVLHKLDSIGIEVIDLKEWIPDNISIRDSLLGKFHFLQYLYTVFQKFQIVDSNLTSIAGAKAFRTWARSMTDNNIFCALKIDGDITKGLDISIECKRTITQNRRYYNNKLKDFITKSSDFMRVYNRINEQLDRLLIKAKNLGYANIQGDFTFIMWDNEIQARTLFDSRHRDENTKDYIAYPIEQIDPNIPACNWTLNHNASFILIFRNEMLCRAVYKNYHYFNMSESFIDSINKSHIAIVSGNDDLSYWSESLHALRKSVVYEE